MPQVFRRILPVVSAGAGVGMNGSTVTGNGKVFLGDHAAPDGGKDGNPVKELLEAAFKMKRDISAVHDAGCEFFCNLRL